MRGLPGSGKSRYIRDMCDNFEEEDYSYFICNYQYYLDQKNPRDIPKSYNICFNKFIECLDKGDINTIFIDNPNIEEWEYKNYIDLGKLYGYQITIIEIGCPDYNYIEFFWNRCSSKINLNNMISMWKRWEMTKSIHPKIPIKEIEPFVEIDTSENGDCLPFPKKTKKKLDEELDLYQKKLK